MIYPPIPGLRLAFDDNMVARLNRGVSLVQQKCMAIRSVYYTCDEVAICISLVDTKLTLHRGQVEHLALLVPSQNKPTSQGTPPLLNVIRVGTVGFALCIILIHGFTDLKKT